MALYEVDAPDGITYRVEAPDGTPPELVSQKFQRDLYPEILREKNKPAAPEEKQSAFRQVADVPLQVGKGAVSGIRMISDAFGAGSDTSNTIRGVEDYLGGLLSAKSQKNAQEISRIMSDAKDKGVYDQVVAAVRAIGTAPVDLVSNALGTSAPAIIAGLLAPEAAIGAAVAAGVGAVIGAGSIKGSIYDEVKQELAGKLPPEEVEILKRAHGRRAHIAHGGAQAAGELMQHSAHRPLIGHLTLDAFGHEFHLVLDVLLEVAVGGAARHGAHRAHAAIGFERAALIEEDFPRALFCPRQKRANHHAISPSRQSLGHIA